MTTAAAANQDQYERSETVNSSKLEPLINIAKEKGFGTERNKDYGFGPIDLVWNITTHPALPKIKCGFVVLRAEERGAKDSEDNQYSLRKYRKLQCVV